MGSCIFRRKLESFSTTDIPKSFFELSAKNIDGNLVQFSDYKNKKAIVVVNVASSCGLTTKQYKGLVQLHQKYKDQGLEILGFPSNQFFKQESKCELEIKDFVKIFKVEFPMFSKVDVNGNNPHPVFKFLRVNSELYDPQTKQARQIPWNFGKFLVNNEGKVQGFWQPDKAPQALEEAIEKLLKQ